MNLAKKSQLSQSEAIIYLPDFLNLQLYINLKIKYFVLLSDLNFKNSGRKLNKGNISL